MSVSISQSYAVSCVLFALTWCRSYEMCFPRNIFVARAIKEGTQYLDAKTVTRRTLKLFTSLLCSLVF